MTDLPNPVSFDTALEKFLVFLKKEKRSSATVTAYSSDLSQLKSYFSSHRITQATTIQAPHLQDYLNYIGGNGYTPKSVSRKINSLRTFFKFLHSQKITPNDPALALVHPKHQPKTPRILTPPEYKNLRDACRLDIRLCAIVELLLQTGIRISELANIYLEDFKKNELYIRPLENNLPRIIPLSHSAAVTIQNYLAVRPTVKDNHLFVTKTGHSLLVRNIRTAIDRYFTRAGVKNVKVNDLRHTFIAHQLSCGTDPEYLTKIVGHKRSNSTFKYLEHIRPPSRNFRPHLSEL